MKHITLATIYRDTSVNEHQCGYGQKGDWVVVTAGVPFGLAGTTNR